MRILLTFVSALVFVVAPVAVGSASVVRLNIDGIANCDTAVGDSGVEVDRRCSSFAADTGFEFFATGGTAIFDGSPSGYTSGPFSIAFDVDFSVTSANAIVGRAAIGNLEFDVNATIQVSGVPHASYFPQACLGGYGIFVSPVLGNGGAYLCSFTPGLLSDVTWQGLAMLTGDDLSTFFRAPGLGDYTLKNPTGNWHVRWGASSISVFEPATLVLMSLGIGMLGFARRIGRRK